MHIFKNVLNEAMMIAEFNNLATKFRWLDFEIHLHSENDVRSSLE